MPKAKQQYLDTAVGIKLVQTFGATRPITNVVDEYEPTSVENRKFQSNPVHSRPDSNLKQDGWILIEKTGPEPRDYQVHGFTTKRSAAQAHEDQNPPAFRQQIPDVKFVKPNKFPRDRMAIELDAVLHP